MDETAPALDPMAQTALRSMKDIVLPQPISMMPQTWGWLLLAGLVVVALLAWVIVTLRRYYRNAYRREALKCLAAIEPRLHAQASRQAAVYDIALLLKQVAIAAWGRPDVGKLSGEDWSSFLSTHGGTRARSLLGKMVDDFEYRDAAVLRRLPGTLADELVEDARRWIENHHV